MSAHTAQAGARYLAAEQQEQQTERVKKRRVVSTGRGGSRLVPATAPLFEVAALHAGLSGEAFLEAVGARF